MDDNLRTGLWNAFYQSFPVSLDDENMFHRYRTLPVIYRKVFVDFLKQNVDEYCGEYTYYAPRSVSRQREMDNTINAVKVLFLQGEWYEVYDLVEFLMEHSNDEGYKNLCSVALEKENSAYKIVGKFVTEITSEQEITEIETARQIPFDSAKSHLEKALALFSDRENPDYENSIKESIHAVESIAKEITGKENSLNALTQELKLHPNLTNGLNELYNWTSKDGIRHGKSGKPLSVDQDTARFMLVTCSAFVNYIIARHQTT